MKLRCKNHECESNSGNETPLFTVNMTVDCDGDACESARKIDGEYFTCCHCADNAEWVNTVVCQLCEKPTDVSTAHLHQGGWIGVCCWDDRLKASE